VIPPLPRIRALLAAATIALLLAGCATTGNPRDPLEPVNRVTYKFNEGVDALFLRPAAEFYRAIVPDFARTGVSNFFSNINDVIVALNDLLQGKFAAAGNDVARIAINTVLGGFGLFDNATRMGFDKNNEDFGQTLGRWGFGDGPYIVLPFIGPSSVRDTVGWVGDYYAWPVTYVDPDKDRNRLILLRFIDARTDLLEASAILETAALDPYDFVRDAYLQRRRNLVYDGNPPDEDGGDTREAPPAGLKDKPEPAPKAKPEGETKPKPSSRLQMAPPPYSAEQGSDTPVAASQREPTPAELEARERAAPANSSSGPTSAAPAPASAPVTRVWLPADTAR